MDFQALCIDWHIFCLTVDELLAGKLVLIDFGCKYRKAIRNLENLNSYELINTLNALNCYCTLPLKAIASTFHLSSQIRLNNENYHLYPGLKISTNKRLIVVANVSVPLTH